MDRERVPIGTLKLYSLFVINDGWGVVQKHDLPDQVTLYTGPHGITHSMLSRLLVRPIDLLALLAEYDEMSGILHDRREDQAPWIERGAAMERSAILHMLKMHLAFFQNRDGFELVRKCLEGRIDEVRSRGPILPQLPPDRLKAENERLRAALERIAQFDTPTYGETRQRMVDIAVKALK